MHTCVAKDIRFVHADHTESAIDMLHAYRKHCAANSSPGQLILPESLKLLPLYLSAIEKLGAFTPNRPQQQQQQQQQPAGDGKGGAGSRPGTGLGGGSRTGGAGAFADVTVRCDARAAELVTLNGLAPSRLIPFFYPRLYQLHNLSGAHGVPLEPEEDPAAAAASGGGGRDPVPPGGLTFEQLMRVVTPPTTFPSIDQVTSHGIYLLESAAGLYLHVGIDADEELLGGLFGPRISAATQLEPGIPLPQLTSALSLRVWTIIAAIRARRPPYLPLAVVVPMDAEGRERFGSLLAEDRLGPARSYVDLLCSMHSAIQVRLTSGQ